MEAKQFTGTLGNAKELAEWVGADAVAGATAGFTDDMPGGFNLVSEVGGYPHYTDAYATDWIVKNGDGVAIMTDAQFRLLFPDYNGGVV